MVFRDENKTVATILSYKEFLTYKIYCYFDEHNNIAYVSKTTMDVGDLIKIEDDAYLIENKYVQEKQYTKLILRKINISYEVLD